MALASGDSVMIFELAETGCRTVSPGSGLNGPFFDVGRHW